MVTNVKKTNNHLSSQLNTEHKKTTTYDVWNPGPVFIYIYWCPPQFSHQMMFVSFYSSTTGTTSGTGTASSIETLGITRRVFFSEIPVAQSLVFCVLIGDSFILISLFLW